MLKCFARYGARRSSIAFYTQVLGAKEMEEWRTGRLGADGISKLRTLSP